MFVLPTSSPHPPCGALVGLFSVWPLFVLSLRLSSAISLYFYGSGICCAIALGFLVCRISTGRRGSPILSALGGLAIIVCCWGEGFAPSDRKASRCSTLLCTIG